MALGNLQQRVANNRPVRTTTGSGVAQARPAPPAIGLSQARPVAQASRGLPQGGLGNITVNTGVDSDAVRRSVFGYIPDSQEIREGIEAQIEYGDVIGGIQGAWNAYIAGLGGNPYSQADLLQAERTYWAGGGNTTLAELMRNRDAGYRSARTGAGLGLYSGATAGRRFRVGTDYLGNLGEIQRDYTIREQQKQREEDAARHQLEARQRQIREEGLRRFEEREPPPVPAPEGGSSSGGSGPGAFATITVRNPRTGRKEKKKIGISRNRRA